MAQLILHSDDLGLHSSINEGILECAELGVLTSASVLANGDAMEQALKQSRHIRAFDVGVHLNIVRGPPLSKPGSIPSLVDGRGLFVNSMAALMIRSRRGLLRVGDICTEYRSQIKKVIDCGGLPSHVDSEKHSHILIPEAAEALSQVCLEFGIKRVRRINETSLSRRLGLRPAPAPLGQHAKRWLLERATKRASLRWPDLASTDYTFGLMTVGCRDAGTTLGHLRAIFSLPGSLSVEWFFHLGKPLHYQSLADVWGTYTMTDDRVTEAEFLKSPSVRELLAEHQADLTSYRGIGPKESQ